MRIYQVDAFCRGLFSGNPAAVCPLEAWLPDGVLQQIAAEKAFLFCGQPGDRVAIRGAAKKYMEGRLFL